ncbi:uncharacterized protein DUF4136 [Lacibacter cauensis]|uniref:Uncharacterized protein DUF4136 n=1 Tax=Lacibacter cauensis TaxID=510947 RepID=A0A562SD77_9BACT|nr:DUF4136 domain-containing protein [Lacibacter cauensis]TWI79259.1 uncharacterized protein DUF4136 [Lacibacter cauensis]
MKNYWSRWMFVPALIFLFSSCGPSAHIEKDKSVDFSRYKTFAWVDKDGEGRKDRNNRNDITESNIRTAVNKQLQKAGFEETKRRPDILLSYDLLVERSTVQNNDPVYSQPFTRAFYSPYYRRYFFVNYPSQFIGYDRSERSIKEGTVTISMIDARSGKTVWQGWATDEVSSRNLTSKEIDAVVRSIFKKADLAKR